MSIIIMVMDPPPMYAAVDIVESEGKVILAAVNTDREKCITAAQERRPRARSFFIFNIVDGPEVAFRELVEYLKTQDVAEYKHEAACKALAEAVTGLSISELNRR